MSPWVLYFLNIKTILLYFVHLKVQIFLNINCCHSFLLKTLHFLQKHRVNFIQLSLCKKKNIRFDISRYQTTSPRQNVFGRIVSLPVSLRKIQKVLPVYWFWLDSSQQYVCYLHNPQVSKFFYRLSICKVDRVPSERGIKPRSNVLSIFKILKRKSILNRQN